MAPTVGYHSRLPCYTCVVPMAPDCALKAAALTTRRKARGSSVYMERLAPVHAASLNDSAARGSTACIWHDSPDTITQHAVAQRVYGTTRLIWSRRKSCFGHAHSRPPLAHGSSTSCV
eukprot:3424676-Prymnesium_polylepis.1